MPVELVRAADLPRYVPYAVGTTSDGLGWRGLGAELVRGHAPGEIHLPPLDHHLLNLIVAVPNRHQHRWDGQSRLETWHPGTASLVPAGAPSYWQWHYVEHGSPCDFHLHFEPAFVCRVAVAALEQLPRNAELHGKLCFADPEVHALGLGLLRAVENRGLHGALYALAICLGAILLVSPTLRAQDAYPVPNATAVAQAAARVNSGEFDFGDVAILRNAHSGIANDALRRLFPEEKNRILKVMIASALVTGGDKDPEYWDFLANEARKVVVSDMPSLVVYQPDGKPSPEAAPAFLTWAKRERLSEQDAAQLSFDHARVMSIVSETKDRRAIPILRAGACLAGLLCEHLCGRGSRQPAGRRLCAAHY